MRPQNTYPLRLGPPSSLVFQGQPTVGTGEVLFAVMELYRGAFTCSLYTHGVTLDQLLARLAHGSGPVAEGSLTPAAV